MYSPIFQEFALLRVAAAIFQLGWLLCTPVSTFNFVGNSGKQPAFLMSCGNNGHTYTLIPHEFGMLRGTAADVPGSRVLRTKTSNVVGNTRGRPDFLVPLGNDVHI